MLGVRCRVLGFVFTSTQNPTPSTSMLMEEQSLQERYAPRNACFGCGPANEKGLRIRSFVGEDGEEVVCDWKPEPHHEAYPGMLNGGIVGTLLDCHSNRSEEHTSALQSHSFIS